MLNDDFADRTLPPTERHRREARTRGEVTRSGELTSAMMLFAVSGLLWFLTPASANALVGLLRNTLSAPPATSLSVNIATENAQAAIKMGATIVWPIMLMLVVSGLAANVTQTGWLWAPGTILPRFRLGRVITWDMTTKATGMILRLCMLAGVTLRFLMTHDWQLRSLGIGEPIAMLVQPARMLAELFVQLSLTLVVLAFVDYGFQFWRHEQRLKMTVEERRREDREAAMDPRIKQRRIAIGGGLQIPIAVSEIGPIDAASSSP